MRLQASDVVLTNIRKNALTGVDFDLYIQILGTNQVLNRQALLQAVMVCCLVNCRGGKGWAICFWRLISCDSVCWLVSL